MTEALKRDYRVKEEIGRGKYGVVFRCYSAVTGDCFAMKSIDKRLIENDAVDRQCLYNEAKIMQLVSSNNHPNVLRIFDVFEDDCFLHIVLEYCDPSDLFERIHARPVLTESEARNVMVPLMEAIALCHRLGVAHRDIKPDNILFNDSNELKLADFGSAEFFPDVWHCWDSLLYGSGGVSWKLASIPPFYGESAKEIFDAVLRANLRFPARVFDSVSPGGKDLLRRMLCRDVSKRFSADQVLRHPWMKRSADTRSTAVLS
ncbi:phosphoenolpyruvate carboxylase kinase 1-like [Olea europaea subsp. europaea]|uniref:Phosphoenolpyruvate carboxylase kinase 1-like n=1 Tax=Olea europaea subsp. europaea TaxID=158383 RepID=A0A8S0UZG0_OLEEU|nr:phosphoenolpyruvate carboxylase kinase 1-like [Olea europaea subsp. europaea]